MIVYVQVGVFQEIERAIHRRRTIGRFEVDNP